MPQFFLYFIAPLQKQRKSHWERSGLEKTQDTEKDFISLEYLSTFKGNKGRVEHLDLKTTGK